MRSPLEVFEVVFLVLAAFVVSLFGDADAQIVPSIPYTLTNGSLADATQVMGNFNTIVTDVNANAATNGANTNITALTGLTTPLSNTYGGTVIYTGGTTGGSANAQTLATVVPSNYANTAGNIVTGVAGFTNTTSPTLAVNAQAAAQTVITTPLGLISSPAKTLVTGQGFLAMFDGTYFEILSAPPNSVANSQLALMSNNTLKGNISGGNATPSDLTLASAGLQLASNANLVTRVQRQVFPSTATYTPCTGLIYADGEIWGGGGGGGGVSNVGEAVAAGGGAGGYSKKVLSFALVSNNPTVTIGAVGAAGSNAGGTGGTGGTTSIGSLISATGGVGGSGNTSASIGVTGGAGGTGSSGNINATGMAGFPSTSNASANGPTAGAGGSTSLGGNGQGFSVGPGSLAGNAGVANSGSGGSGAGNNNGGPSANTGGAGGTGFAVITEYCNQ